MNRHQDMRFNLALSQNKYQLLLKGLKLFGSIVFLFEAYGNKVLLPDFARVFFIFLLMFLLPGSIILELFLKRNVNIVYRLPMSFAISVGLWTIPTTILMLGQSQLTFLIHLIAWLIVGIATINFLISFTKIKINVVN